SASCTVAEDELIILLDFEEDLLDWETDLEADLLPVLSPSSPLVLSSPPEPAPPEYSPTHPLLPTPQLPL
ncbi:hypothetical protein M9458_035018, partial [Cirrhinus mrigala]